jgi:hypothetical protein
MIPENCAIKVSGVVTYKKINIKNKTKTVTNRTAKCCLRASTIVYGGILADIAT